MVTTNDEPIAERLRQVVNHGRTDTYEHAFPGYNFRMTNIHAAIGRDQLTQLDDWVTARRKNASRLTDGLSEVEGIKTPTVPADRRHAFHQYTVRTTARDDIIESLEADDIGYGIYYPQTIPDQPAYDHTEVEIPTARRLADRVLSLPVHPKVDETEVDRIITVIRQGIN